MYETSTNRIKSKTVQKNLIQIWMCTPLVSVIHIFMNNLNFVSQALLHVMIGFSVHLFNKT